MIKFALDAPVAEGHSMRELLSEAADWASFQGEFGTEVQAARDVLARGISDPMMLWDPEYALVRRLLDEATTYWENQQYGDGDPLPEEAAWLADMRPAVAGLDAEQSPRTS